MFPLGSVVLPGMVVPLHVFEPRYQQMVADCQAGDGTFGVVLIERGSEVGGGDVRTDLGTLARIVEARALPDGRWLLGVAGVERIRVESWLPDDPYPRAEVTAWPDVLDDPDHPDDPDEPSDRDVALGLLRRVTALSAELGRQAPPLDLDLPDDPILASYVAVAASPLGAADRQRLLAAPRVPARWTLLTELLTDQLELLQALL